MKERKKYIDIAKGIGALLVMLGHAEITGSVKVWLYSFHMPLFFYISGLSIKYEKFDEKFLLKRAKSLLVPYAQFSIAYFIFQILKVLLKKESIQEEMRNDILGQIFQIRNTEFSGVFWFLPAMFGGMILVAFAIKVSQLLRRQDRMLMLFFLVYYCIGVILVKNNLNLPWNFDTAFIIASFSISGCLSRKIVTEKAQIERNNKRAVICAAFFAMSIIFTYINYLGVENSSDLYWRRIGNPVIYLCAGLSGTGFIILFSMLIGESRLLQFVGKNSLSYYCLHQIFIYPFIRRILTFLNISSRFFPYCLMAITAICIFPICILLNEVVPKLSKQFKYEVGRRILR